MRALGETHGRQQRGDPLERPPHHQERGRLVSRRLSLTDDGGTKIYAVSGRVKRPGFWELPLGTTIREVIEEHAGGMREGYTARAVIPGGGSTEFVLPEHFDTPMAFDIMEKQAGSRLGTGTMIVLDDATCPVGAVHNLTSSFSPANPAAGARPAATACPGSRACSATSKRAGDGAKTWTCSRSIRGSSRCATRTAPWRRALSSRCKAPLRTSKTISSAT